MSTTRIALMFIAAYVSHANAQGGGFEGGFDFPDFPDLTNPVIGGLNLPLIPMANRISDGESHMYFDPQAAMLPTPKQHHPREYGGNNTSVNTEVLWVVGSTTRALFGYRL